MANVKKIAVLCGCGVLFASAAVVAGLTAAKPEDGTKSFTVEVFSGRDGVDRSQECSSELDYFGQWCREQDFIEWQESGYGIYISAVDGCSEDIDEQYWWCIMVNGESAVSGADELPITDGTVYRLELMQGW